MRQALVLSGPRRLAYEELPEDSIGPDEVLIQTLYSGISAGTEMTQYRGTNPYLHKRWDTDTRLFLAGAETSLTYPIRTWGYEEVGQVVETGREVHDIAPGTHIFGTWGHRTHFVAPAEYARARLMPVGLDPVLGIFSHIGAIALNGVHDGRVRIGETVAVFGLGVLGQIVAQAARRSGARVIAVDLHPARLDMAHAHGAHVVLDASATSAAKAVKELTEGRGADVCFEVSGSTAALNEAIRAAAYSARVVAMGFFQGEAQGLLLGEEFHHNRINVVCSQISGSDPELKYRWDKLRLWQSAIRLQADELLNLRGLITHMAPFEQAPDLFRALDETPQDVMQAVMQFPLEGA